MIDWTIVASILVAAVILGVAYTCLKLISMGEGALLFWSLVCIVFIIGVAAAVIVGGYFLITHSNLQ